MRIEPRTSRLESARSYPLRYHRGIAHFTVFLANSILVGEISAYYSIMKYKCTSNLFKLDISTIFPPTKCASHEQSS